MRSNVNGEQKKFRDKYRVESTRLKYYDYSNDGAYFITVCTKNRECCFGEILDGELIETIQVKIIKECWLDLPNHYTNCTLDEFVVMPNHVHGIIFIHNDSVETGFKPVSTNTNANNARNDHKQKRYSLSEIMRGFKTFSARKINEYQNTKGNPFWQSRFYDRVIRNPDELSRTRKYIIENPLKWELDRNNPRNLNQTL